MCSPDYIVRLCGKFNLTPERNKNYILALLQIVADANISGKITSKDESAMTLPFHVMVA